MAPSAEDLPPLPPSGGVSGDDADDDGEKMAAAEKLDEVVAGEVLAEAPRGPEVLDESATEELKQKMWTWSTEKMC